MTSKISSRSSGVLTANSRVPSGDSASGRTCPLSKVVNAPAGAAASVPITDSASSATGAMRRPRRNFALVPMPVIPYPRASDRVSAPISLPPIAP